MKLLTGNFEKVLLSVVILLAFLLRFVGLTSFPVGFNADEASFGYDAYSILKTSRDQWGKTLPLALKSFGDYKSPLYSYLALPSIAIFGLTKFAVRLPNVIIGTLAVFAAYLLTSQLLNKKLGLLSAFLLAINPWSIMLSRAAIESNLITLFLPIGIYFFLKGLKDTRYLTWAAVFFGLNLFTYHSAKLITPIVLLGLSIIYLKHFRKVGFKKYFLPLTIFLVFFLGLLYTFRIGGGVRVAERSIFQGALEEGAEERIRLIQTGRNPAVTRIFHNKYQVILERFTTNYLQYFSYRFLITRGAGEGYYGMVPGIGMTYVLDIILLAGLPFLWLKKKSRSLMFWIFIWLLVSPLPAALSTGVGYSGSRAEGMMPALQIMEVLGFTGWLAILSRIDRRVWGVFGVIAFVFVSFEVTGFVKRYFQDPPYSVARSMLFGSLAVSDWLKSNRNGRDVIVSRSLSEPQIFIAFANSWDPSSYQKETEDWEFDDSGLQWLDQMTRWNLGSYTFKSIDWRVDGRSKSALIVARPEELPNGVIPVKTFSYSDGTVAVEVVDPNQNTYAVVF